MRRAGKTPPPTSHHSSPHCTCMPAPPLQHAPEPVGAMASSSLPASRAVVAWRWMGVGSVKPPATRLLQGDGDVEVSARVAAGNSAQEVFEEPRRPGETSWGSLECRSTRLFAGQLHIWVTPGA